MKKSYVNEKVQMGGMIKTLNSLSFIVGDRQAYIDQNSTSGKVELYLKLKQYFPEESQTFNSGYF